MKHFNAGSSVADLREEAIRRKRRNQQKATLNPQAMTFHPSSQALFTGKFGVAFTPEETSSPAKATERALQTIEEDPPKNEVAALVLQVKQLQQQLENMDQTHQQMNLTVNRLQEEQWKHKVQMEVVQPVVDSLQQKVHDLQKTKDVLKWFYATPVQQRPLYTTNLGRTEEFVTPEESVLLLYPLVTDAEGTVWVTVRRLFDNGTVEDFKTQFYSEKTLCFTKFTFSNASCN
jgi:hypothetical protein